MKINQGFILRKVGGESVVVPVGEATKQFQGMINLNEVGAFLWNFFTQERSIEEAVDALTAEYAVDRERAETDVKAFCEQLTKRGFAK